MTDAQSRKLETQLAQQLRDDCAEAESIGYQPKKFRTMMAVSGPISACEQVILSQKIPDGFLTLLELKRLDLTAEATVLRGPWKSLFGDEVLEAARKRLRDYQHSDLAV